MSQLLFSEAPFGRTQLKNRVVMAPLTRSRAIGNVPNDLMALYYAQRAGAGLIITEGTSPSPNGLGYSRIPGLFNEEQVKGWRKVTDRVHESGGKVFVQLMHTGRVGHALNLPKGARVLAPSAIALSGKMYTDERGPVPYPTPEEMSDRDIEQALAEYVHAARLAVDAGFDGVELHGANGYLIDQFLNAESNHRTDSWGGRVENRIRFAVQAARRVGEAIGFDRLGIRLSPYGAFNDMKPDPETEDVYERLAEELGKLGLLYIHVVDHSAMGAPAPTPSVRAKISAKFGGHVILSGGYDAERAEADLVEGKGHLVAFGRPFISNPNLVAKLKDRLTLTQADSATFYTPGPQGYTDYL